MAERQSISQVIQVGVESTQGTAVAANKRLTALSISPGVTTDVAQFRPSGSKYRTLAIQNVESVEASLTGQPTYSEIVYPLSSVVCAPVVTQIMDEATPTGAYKWVFDPSIAAAADPVKSFTVEQGDNIRAHRFGYGIVSELGLSFARDGLSLDGSMMGQRLQDNVTLTASPTLVDLIPIIPTHIDIFLNNDFASIGTTKMLRVTSANFNIGGRFSPLWVLDSAQPSWVTHLEGEPDVTSALTMSADASGMALLETLRLSGTKFLRIRAVGNAIYSGGSVVSYSLTIDASVKVIDVGSFDDVDGLFGINFDFVVVVDKTVGWNRAYKIEVVNKLASL